MLWRRSFVLTHNYLKDEFAISPNISDETSHEIFKRRHIIQDFQLVWLNVNADETKYDITECIAHSVHDISTTNVITGVDQIYRVSHQSNR